MDGALVSCLTAVKVRSDSRIIIIIDSAQCPKGAVYIITTGFLCAFFLRHLVGVSANCHLHKNSVSCSLM